MIDQKVYLKVYIQNSRIEDENVDFVGDDDFDNWHTVNSSIYIKNYSKENAIFNIWRLRLAQKSYL